MIIMKIATQESELECWVNKDGKVYIQIAEDNFISNTSICINRSDTVALRDELTRFIDEYELTKEE